MRGSIHPTSIAGRTFAVCTSKVQADDFVAGQLPWTAWIFFAYDKSINVYPADEVPVGVVCQESIVSGEGETEVMAIMAVSEKLATVVATKSLEGTGFYSAAGGFVYPQELPGEQNILRRDR